MAPIDNALKNLSALSGKLKGETEELNKVIADLDERIRKTGIGVSVWLGNLLDQDERFELMDDGNGGERRVRVRYGWELGYAKVGEVWAIAARKTRGEEVLDESGVAEFVWDNHEPIPLGKSPRHIRVEAASLLEGLIESLSERAKHFIKNIGQAKKLAEQ